MACLIQSTVSNLRDALVCADMLLIVEWMSNGKIYSAAPGEDMW